ncbi:MAG: response regulator [Burkholderiales bacterium]
MNLKLQTETLKRAGPNLASDRLRTLAPQRLLIVDDNVDLASSLAMVMTEWGFEVCTANDGFTALRLARDFDPHIVIADICMPLMDGFELARQLRQSHCSQARLVAVTANDSAEFRAQAALAGFNDFKAKPVDLMELRAALGAKSSH